MITEITERITPELKIYMIWILSSLVNVVALTMWALFQYGLSKIIVKLGLTAIDAWVFLALQIFSAISTLAPIAFFIYRDTRIMWIQTNRDIKKEKLSETPELARSLTGED